MSVLILVVELFSVELFILTTNIFFFMCYRSTKDVKGQRKKDARHAVNMARKT